MPVRVVTLACSQIIVARVDVKVDWISFSHSAPHFGRALSRKSCPACISLKQAQTIGNNLGRALRHFTQKDQVATLESRKNSKPAPD